MIADQGIDAALRGLLREPAPTPDDGLVRALAEVARTPQRRHRWWSWRAVPRRGIDGRQHRLVLLVSTVVAALAIVGAGTWLAAGDRRRSIAPASSPSPTAGAPALELEEVERGVYRVLGDGTEHDLDVPRPLGIKAGPDGSVWLVEQRKEPGRRMFRLGQPGSYDADAAHAHWPALRITPDGTVWATGKGGSKWPSGGGPQLLVMRDGAWHALRPPVGYRVDGVAVAPDGSVFVNGFPSRPASRNGCAGRPSVWRLDGVAWREVPAVPADVASVGDGGDLAAGPDGRLWLAINTFNSLECRGDGGLWRTDGDTWTLIPEVPHGTDIDVALPAIGPDGTLWVYASDDGRDSLTEARPSPPGGGRRLMRFADGSWDTFLASDGVPLLGTYVWKPTMDVGADGTLWVTVSGLVRTEEAFGPGGVGPCAGVRSFDGIAWRTYLAGQCISELSVAPDGRVWVTAIRAAESRNGGWTIEGANVYVIEPNTASSASAPTAAP